MRSTCHQTAAERTLVRSAATNADYTGRGLKKPLAWLIRHRFRKRLKEEYA